MKTFIKSWRDMRRIAKEFLYFAAAMIVITLGGCGGGGSSSTPPPTSPPPAAKTYKVGGSISGVTGAVVLRNNGSDDLSIAANGVFIFNKELADGAAYAVTVATQPGNLNCTVTGGSGTVSGANVSGVVVACVTITPPPANFTVGGTVSGLTGTLILRNNGADDLTVNASGSFTFVTALADKSNFSVTVFAQPNNQTCTVSNGSGAIAAANVTNVAVICAANPPPPPNTYTVGGTVSGLVGTLVLRNNGADNLTLSANSSFTFATALPDASAYSVAVFTQPSNQSCTATNGNGTIAGANVTSVVVNCVNIPPPQAYTIGGTVTGLTGTGLVLRNNGGNDLAISNSGNFTFTNALIAGSAYDVSIAMQPTLQSCSVSNGKGTANGNVTTVTVSCFALQSVIYTRAAAGSQTDIYIVKEDGTGTLALANSANDERTTRKLASGKIIYESGAGTTRSVYIVNADGTGNTLLASSAYLRQDIPIETPSGKIALTQNSKNVIAVNQDGTGLTILGGTNGTKGLAGVTPSGRVIYRNFESTSADVYTIHSIKEDGTGDIKLTPTNTTEYEEVKAITPTGRVIFQRRTAISLSNPNDLFSVNEDGTGLVTLSADAKSDDFVALLPNDRVLYQRPNTSGFPYGQLFSVKADGSGAATLSTDPNNEFYVASTADGKVIYRRSVTDPVTQVSQDDLYIINADGTGLTSLGNSTDHETYHGLTPAGQIIFSRITGAGTGSDLFLVNADGTSELRLTNTPNVYSSAYCVPGCVTSSGRLIFIRSDNIQNKLVSINLDGTGEVVLTTGAASEFFSAITTSGRLIIGRDLGSNNYDLYSIRADGTDLKSLAITLDGEYFERLY